MLMNLSKGWEKIYDPGRKLMWPKLDNGKFFEDFNPAVPHNGFQEGNAYQYTFYVPHDPEGIVAKMGKDEFNTRLDSIFIISQKDLFGGGKEIFAFAGIRKPYNHGNQPCLHTSFLFNHSGKPSLTQKWVRAICKDFYGTEGIHGYGFGQDEDQGQLGAWYVMAGIGLFDVRGLTAETPEFGISSPLFDKITIKLNNKYYSGNQFVFETDNNSPDNTYIRSVSVNGETIHGTFLPFSEIVGGGKMTIRMGNTPVDKY
jgi:putative alpha-1,2-mannosidase